jgi:hypothetical protein
LSSCNYNISFPFSRTVTRVNFHLCMKI